MVRQRAEECLLISTPIHSLKNPKILVVDDNLAIHESFRKILGIEAEEANFNAVEEAFFGTSNTDSPASGFTLEFASQGGEALGLVTTAMLAALPYAMVFMDVRMPPGWDGIETTARSRKVDPYLQVVICTTYTDYS